MKSENSHSKFPDRLRLLNSRSRPAFTTFYLAVTSLVFAATFASGGESSIRTIAGNGNKGYDGDGGPAIAAKLNDPGGIVRGPDGVLYICDTANHRIRKVGSDGIITTIAGNGEKGWAGDGGAAVKAKLNEPYEVRLDTEGNVFWVERLSHTVRRMDRRTGIVITVAGNGSAGFSGDNGPGSSAQLNDPHSIGFDKAGNLYICDVRNHRIRKVNLKTGIISTFSGTGERKSIVDGDPISGSPLNGPRALDFDSDGNLWLALREGNAILKFDLARSTVNRVAGTGAKGFAGNDGPAREAVLNGPKGIAVGPDGNIYIADTENHVIRVIDAKTGIIRNAAGTGERGDGPEEHPLTCKLARPHGVFVDRSGSLLIGDTETHRIRVVTFQKQPTP